MARPAGSRNIIPSRAEVAALVADLRRRAESGDPRAAGELVRLGLQKPKGGSDARR